MKEARFVRRVREQPRPASRAPAVREFHDHELIDIMKGVAPYGNPAGPFSNLDRPQNPRENIIGDKITNDKSEQRRSRER